MRLQPDHSKSTQTLIKLPNIPVQVKLKLKINTLLFVSIRKMLIFKLWLFLGVFNEAILKDSDYTEVDRAECQFTTTGTVLDNGTQVCSFRSNV